MSNPAELIERAIGLSKAGRKLEAQPLFLEALTQEPRNDRAWLWYVDTFSSAGERVRILQEMLKIFPHHPVARKALTALQPEPVLQAAPPPAPVPKPQPAAVIQKPQPPQPELSPLERLRAQHPSTGAGRPVPPTVTAKTVVSKPTVLPKVSEKKPAPKITILPVLLILFGVIGLMVGAAALWNTSNYLSQISALSSNNTRLNDQVTLLDKELNAQRVQYQTLMTEYQNTESELKTLKETALLPPFISVYNRYMLISFLRTDNTNGLWDVSFDTLEYELQRGAYARYTLTNDPSMWIQLPNANTGETYDVVDMTKFVDPSSFTEVIPELYTLAGSDEAFIREVWNIVTQLATYSSDIEETPRYPLETFLAGGGDCEDTAILFASMILAAPVNWDVELVYLDLDHPTSPLDVNHVIVYINTGNGEHWIETTEGDVMEPYTSGVTGWYFQLY